MPLHVRMTGRDPDEEHPAATPLELFSDLAFVVAVAQASSSLHHGLVDGHASDVLVAYPLVFFAIWWAWVNFTWFGSAYDTDDVVYRVAVFVQIAGVLILAAGVPRVFVDQDWGVVVTGYVVIRVALVGLWLRVASSHPERRRTALCFATGITLCQIAWIVLLFLPEWMLVPAFVVCVACEMFVPYYAEGAGGTPWHPGHVTERYGLFTIIVLGESCLAATIGVQQALDADGALADLATVVIGGLLIVFAMWWTYFDLPIGNALEGHREDPEERSRDAFIYGYCHYFVFAGAAAVGAGLAVAVDQATDHSVLTDTEAGFALTVPLVIFFLAVWLLDYRDQTAATKVIRRFAVPFTVGLVLLASFTAEPVLLAGLVAAALVVLQVVLQERARVDPEAGDRGVPVRD